MYESGVGRMANKWLVNDVTLRMPLGNRDGRAKVHNRVTGCEPEGVGGTIGAAALVRALVSKAVVSTQEVWVEAGRGRGWLLNLYPMEWEPRASLSEM